jgi:hypothetical protein
MPQRAWLSLTALRYDRTSAIGMAMAEGLQPRLWPVPGAAGLQDWNPAVKTCPSRSVGDPWLHADKKSRGRDLL